jgi:hypothetical protein
VPASQADHVLESLKRVAALLRDAGIPFALAGGLAAWARGGPPTEKDIDLVIREADAPAALDVLAAAGLSTEVPPEGWLVKAYDGGLLIDLIFGPAGLVVDDALLERCDELTVRAVPMRVMRVDDLVSTKLLALTEHHLDYGPVLEVCRALREQIDWLELHRRTSHSPFARAFFALVQELGIVEPGALRHGGGANGGVPDDYVIDLVQQRLAGDGRVGELGLDVHLEGTSVVVRGVVSTEARQRTVAAVVQDVLDELACPYQVRDDTAVLSAAPPERAEEEIR